MGRSSKAGALMTRDKIVEAASRLFRQRGVGDVSIAEIMCAAGLTVGGFYKHFASKEALVRATMDLAFAQAVQYWRAIAAEAGAYGRTEKLVGQYLQGHPPQFNCPMTAFAPHIGRDSADVATIDCYSGGVARLLDVFDGEVPDADTHGHSSENLVLFAAMVGAAMLTKAGAKSDWGRDLHDAILEAAANRRFADGT